MHSRAGVSDWTNYSKTCRVEARIKVIVYRIINFACWPSKTRAQLATSQKSIACQCSNKDLNAAASQQPLFVKNVFS